MCFIDVFFRLLLRLQVPALICSWGCISRCCLEQELNFLETFVHIVVEDMDSLRFFSLSASIFYFFDHETLCTLLGFKTSVPIRQAVVIIHERSLIHNRTLDGNRCEEKKKKTVRTLSDTGKIYKSSLSSTARENLAQKSSDRLSVCRDKIWKFLILSAWIGIWSTGRSCRRDETSQLRNK